MAEIEIAEIKTEAPRTHCSYCGKPLPGAAYRASGYPYACCDEDCLDACVWNGNLSRMPRGHVDIRVYPGDGRGSN